MSVGGIDAKSLSRIRARLLLRAVLPALTQLVDSVPEAAALLPEKGLRVAFRGRRGVRQALHLNRHGGSRSAEDLPADIVLQFFSDAQAQSQLLGKVILPPLPLRGLTHIASLRAFAKVSDMLQVYLRPVADLQTQPAGFVRTHVELSLAVALRAVCELCQCDPAVASIIAKAPDGTVCFTVAGAEASGDAGAGANRSGASENSKAASNLKSAKDSCNTVARLLWLKIAGTQASCGVSTAAGGGGQASADTFEGGTADAYVYFADLSVAAGALRNQVDEQAQVGYGGIRVRGFLPLADAASAALAELKRYLPTE